MWFWPNMAPDNQAPRPPDHQLPTGHCPLHLEPMFGPGEAGPWHTTSGSMASRLDADWCSSCDAELMWALQRPHLQVVPRG